MYAINRLILFVAVVKKKIYLSSTPGRVDRQRLPQQMKIMTSFISEQILLRKKSSLDGVHPLQAIQMDGVSPLQKLVTGSSPHLMLHSHHLRHNKQ